MSQLYYYIFFKGQTSYYISGHHSDQEMCRPTGNYKIEMFASFSDKGQMQSL